MGRVPLLHHLSSRRGSRFLDVFDSFSGLRKPRRFRPPLLVLFLPPSLPFLFLSLLPSVSTLLLANAGAPMADCLSRQGSRSAVRRARRCLGSASAIFGAL